MKVLWITNVLLPEAYFALTGKQRLGSGGWLSVSAELLNNSGIIQLSIATASPLVKELTVFKRSSIDYYIFPFSKGNTPIPYVSYMSELKRIIGPDVVHIHGTEFPYGLAYIEANGPESVVISIQGIISVIGAHYLDGLSKLQVLRSVTLRDLRLKTIFEEQKDYCLRGTHERNTISRVQHIIGRTSFDERFVKSINPDVQYHFCNESLREQFYCHEWTYNNCVPYSIFVSQSNYPIKGLHQLLKALPIILKKYPTTRVRIAGEDITKHKTISELKKFGGYGCLISKMIKKYNLQDCVAFTGLLDEMGMVREYLSSNLFICPSSFENSSNSIGEAQLLGVPCIASLRGGNPDLIPNTQSGLLYDFYDIEGLADLVCEVFHKSSQYDNSYERELASHRHSRSDNLKKALMIYKQIYEAHGD